MGGNEGDAKYICSSRTHSSSHHEGNSIYHNTRSLEYYTGYGGGGGGGGCVGGSGWRKWISGPEPTSQTTPGYIDIVIVVVMSNGRVGERAGVTPGTGVLSQLPVTAGYYC